MKTVQRYIINEIWPVFFSGLFIFVFIALSAQMLNRSEVIVSFAVKPLKILSMSLYLIPGLVLFALPAVSLAAVLMAFLRMSGDNEIMALKSLGVGLKQMLPAVLLVCFTACGLSVFLSFYGAPWASNAFNNLVYQIARTTNDLGIKERVFSSQYNGIIFYVQKFSAKDRSMADVFILDARDRNFTTTYIAKSGSIAFYPEAKAIRFQLKDVEYFRTGTKASKPISGKSDAYDLSVGLNEILANFKNREPSAKEIPINRFIRELKKAEKGSARYNEMMTELMNKFTLPLAVLLMGLIGFPLGAQIKSGGRLAGIVISSFVFLLYYSLLAGTKGVAETGWLSPKYGTWVPIVFLTAAYVYLFRRAKNERSIHFFEKYLGSKNSG